MFAVIVKAWHSGHIERLLVFRRCFPRLGIFAILVETLEVLEDSKPCKRWLFDDDGG